MTTSPKDQYEQGERILAKLSEFDVRLKNIETYAKRSVGLELTDLRRGLEMSRSVDELEQNLQRNTKVTDSAIELLRNIVQDFKDAQGDDQALVAVIEKYDANTERLAQAVEAGTEHQPSGM